mmetsp:Transcript_10640/g.34121  ORF Transcript_10640/g.34121 Transcript_10640/m.34121 type:complete len:118 (+) Transcript_10640:80-433(+)
MLSAIILALTFLKDDAMLVGERRKMLFAPEPHVCVQDYCGCECASTIVGVSGCSSQEDVNAFIVEFVAAQGAPVTSIEEACPFLLGQLEGDCANGEVFITSHPESYAAASTCTGDPF